MHKHMQTTRNTQRMSKKETVEHMKIFGNYHITFEDTEYNIELVRVCEITHKMENNKT